MTWNVKDIGVFSELSDALSKTASMVDDIRQEVDDAIAAAESACADAKSAIASRRGTMETDIAQLEDDIEKAREKAREGQERRAVKDEERRVPEGGERRAEEDGADAREVAGEDGGEPEPETAQTLEEVLEREPDDELSELDERLSKAKAQLESLDSAERELGTVQESIAERRRAYEKEFVRARDEYEEDVANACKLLGNIQEILEQGR